MHVRELMVHRVQTCRPDDTLNTAAKVMWDNDCGSVAVLDAQGALVGMITDRDISMAAYTQGRPLSAIRVSSAMARKVFSCKPEDTIATAEQILANHKIRRLPVIDEKGRLVGILSLNDVAREAAHERAGKGRREVSAEEVTETLAAICEPRSSRAPAAAAA